MPSPASAPPSGPGWARGYRLIVRRDLLAARASRNILRPGWRWRRGRKVLSSSLGPRRGLGRSPLRRSRARARELSSLPATRRGQNAHHRELARAVARCSNDWRQCVRKDPRQWGHVAGGIAHRFSQLADPATGSASKDYTCREFQTVIRGRVPKLAPLRRRAAPRRSKGTHSRLIARLAIRRSSGPAGPPDLASLLSSLGSSLSLSPDLSAPAGGRRRRPRVNPADSARVLHGTNWALVIEPPLAKRVTSWPSLTSSSVK
jgi:hypothetical protein